MYVYVYVYVYMYMYMYMYYIYIYIYIYIYLFIYLFICDVESSPRAAAHPRPSAQRAPVRSPRSDQNLLILLV